jgi:hypothetical protein
MLIDEGATSRMGAGTGAGGCVAGKGVGVRGRGVGVEVGLGVGVGVFVGIKVKVAVGVRGGVGWWLVAVEPPQAASRQVMKKQQKTIVSGLAKRIR